MTYGSKITINNQKYYALNATQYVLASDIRQKKIRLKPQLMGIKAYFLYNSCVECEKGRVYGAIITIFSRLIGARDSNFYGAF